MINKPIKIIIIPFLTPRLSSYWVDLITPVKASLARPLIDSLKHEAITKDDTIKEIVPLQLRNFEEAIRAAKEEKPRKSNVTKKERTSHSLNNRVLLISLFALSVMGSTYYIFDPKPEIFLVNWLILLLLWYFGIAFSIYFILEGTRLGPMISGIIGWTTLAFWSTNSVNTIQGHSFLITSLDLLAIMSDFISIATAAIVVVTSHNMFHKIRVYGL